MTLQRMDNVLIVVEDLEAAKAFFAELGMELEGETQVQGPWVDSTVGLNGVRADITMMRTPDGHGRVELTRFHTPPAVRAEPQSAPANALGIRRIMFAVDDIDDVVARLRSHGAELVGEMAQYAHSACRSPSATPCEASVSGSGQRVARSRARRSSSSASGTASSKGSMASCIPGHVGALNGVPSPRQHDGTGRDGLAAPRG